MGVPEYIERTVSLPSAFVHGKIGVVTVTFSSGPTLGDFLSSLAAQTYQNYILIAVDNASKDDTVAQLRGWDAGQTILIANTNNVGVAAGNNQGTVAAIEAGCEYVMLLNNDVILAPDLFQLLVEGLAQNQCSMTVPMMYFYEPPDRIWAAGGAFVTGGRVIHRFENEVAGSQHEQVCAIDYTPTCCVLIHRDVFARIGMMDERYFVYYDDVDFMYRARKAGERMFFLPTARLWHKVSSLTGGLATDFTYRYNARGRALFLYKNCNRLSAIFWMAIHAGFDIIRALIYKSFRHPCAVKLKGMLEGRRVALGLSER